MSKSNLLSPDISKLSVDQVTKLLADIDTIIFDCDGVLWIENKPIPGSVEAFNKLQSIGKRVVLLTNNSVKLRQEFLEKAKKMGYDIGMRDIISSAYLVALYLKNRNFDKKAYVIGSKGIINELELAGIRCLGYGPDPLQHSLTQTIEHFVPDPRVGAVIVGFDEHFCYTKLLKAASYLNNPSCIFLSTNTDESFKIHQSLIMPGTGSILRAVEAVANREAVIVGKPYSFLGEALKKQFNIDPNRTMLVGDRCNTDVQLGKNCRFQTLLVMSGAPNYLSEKTQPLDPTDIPNYSIEQLGNLLPFLPSTSK
ncbi:unnamed protein product [Psylliodes chrysocephalus]|uniref:Phosphoglycolate phosphatase n=1 Tax=Psylliodes chrysocephalus TaxID=3402493 RepID=A0A9P0CU99_9CUCU|nr:unnamed protein product [Psylliodes chrysocephala]